MHKVPDRIHVTRDDDLATAVTADIARRSVVAAFRRGDAIPFAPALLSLKHLFVEKVICGTEDRLEALVRHAHQLLPTKQHAPIVWRDSTDQHACVTKWSRTLASGANTAPDGDLLRGTLDAPPPLPQPAPPQPAQGPSSDSWVGSCVQQCLQMGRPSGRRAPG